jgi:tRNA-specific 2-thiouridylase
VRTATDANKDQSYMLARLEPAHLERLSFPLGGLTKEAVRALARYTGLPVADKRESQDLCFVAGLGGRAFLRRHGGTRLRRAGEIVDRDGRVLGRHDGQHNFTVGQRRGLRLSSPEPMYVLQKNAETGRVTVGPRDALLATRVPLADVRLHRGPEAVDSVRLRYRAAPIRCRMRENGGQLELELERAATAVAPGQLACLMRGDCVVGEGTIGEFT